MDKARVKEFRLRRGWKQRQAADWYGVKLRSWQRYESGDRSVPEPLAKRIVAFGKRSK